MRGKTMTGDDGFLARWSRRKRSAAAKKREPATPPRTAPVAPDASEAIASLPPIETLDAASDITPFLAPGVPAELTRRALRQAWTADPAIRDFVGLSENAWDFNAPGGVPGFGALTPEDVSRLLDELTGTPEATDPSADPSGPATPEPPEIAETEAEQPIVATEPESDQRQRRASVSNRRHGSALPR
jgi:uncharacterized protein DUF3306